MGKTLRYHPVSLNVIRGAVEYVGFRVGKLRQTQANVEDKSAAYVTEVEELPEDLRAGSIWDIAARLNACFASDVIVSAIWITRSQKIMVELKVRNVHGIETFKSVAPEDVFPEGDWLDHSDGLNLDTESDIPF